MLNTAASLTTTSSGLCWLLAHLSRAEHPAASCTSKQSCSVDVKLHSGISYRLDFVSVPFWLPALYMTRLIVLHTLDTMHHRLAVAMFTMTPGLAGIMTEQLACSLGVLHIGIIFAAQHWVLKLSLWETCRHRQPHLQRCRIACGSTQAWPPTVRPWSYVRSACAAAACRRLSNAHKSAGRHGLH